MPLLPPSAAVVRKDLVVTLRRPQAFLVLVLFLLVNGLLVLLLWPEYTLGVPSQLLAQEVRGLFFNSWRVMWFMATLFVPALSAVSVASEREQETLDILRTSLISGPGLVGAKFMNSVGFFLFLFVASLPVFASTMFLVGIDWREMGAVAGLVLLNIATCAAIALYFSARMRRTLSAIALSLVGIALYMLGGGLLIILASVVHMALFFDPPSEGLVTTFTHIFVPYATFSGFTQGGLPAWVLAAGIAYQAAVGVAALVFGARRIMKPDKPRKEEQEKPIDDPLVLRARRRTFPYYLVDPLRRKKPVEDHRNPALVRELRWGLYNRATRLARLFTFSLGLFLLGAAAAILMAPVGDALQVAWWRFQMVVLTLATPALLAGAVTREYESNQLDMLRMSLLTPGEIVWGKAVAGFMAVAPLLLASFLAHAFVVAFVPDAIVAAVVGYISLVACVLLAVAVAVYAGVVARRTAGAMILSYVLVLLVVFGAPALSYLVTIVSARLLPRAETQDSLWEGLHYLNVLSPAGGHFAFAQDSLWAWGASAVVAVALARAIVWAAQQRFRKRRMVDA